MADADIEISVDAGTSKRLLTAGKYCDKNILVTASSEDGGRELVEFDFLMHSASARVPAIQSCNHTRHGELKTQFGPGIFEVDKNSILYVSYELANGFAVTGDCKFVHSGGTDAVVYVYGNAGIELQTEASGGTNSKITDTEALNIITGGGEA